MADAAMKMTSIFCLMMIFNGGFANPVQDPTIEDSDGVSWTPGILANCWYSCEEKGGPCPGFCGSNGWCCRKDHTEDECPDKALEASTSGYHSCVVKSAVNGGWSEYSEWSSCSETCGIGMKSRSRSCTNPQPQFGGQDCQGNSTQTENCMETEHCPVSGGWSDYSEWSSCSETCGIGMKSRSRSCTNPKPQFGGQDCQGNSTQTENCTETEHCPVNGGWSEYSEWSSCSETCGDGIKSRSRSCSNPQPQFNGQDCQGSNETIISCVEIDCPINGGWSEYSEWSSCSETCGNGTKSRSRSCTNPQPQFNGQDCQGSNETIIPCVEIENCPVNGGWSEYSEWSSCSETCGNGMKSRSRNCSNPQPQFDGEDCQGNSNETEKCVEIENCDPVSESDIVSKTQLDSHQGLVPEAWARKTSKPEAEDCGEGFVCCPDVMDGDNILGSEKFVQESQYKESFLNCAEACQTLYPFSNGITQSKTQRYKNGKPKCWCEFGESLFHKNNGYQTCLYAIEEDDYDY